MRPEPLSGVGRLLRLSRARGTRARRTFVLGVPSAFLRPRCVFRLALC